MKRKFLSLLLAVCLIAGLLPTAMVGAETTATDAPTSAPTTTPTTQPTSAPTTVPTTQPTAAPTAQPTSAPTAKPTAAATTAPATTPAETTKPADETKPTTTAPVTAPTTPPTAAPMTEPSGVVNPTTSVVSVSIKLCETSTTQSFLAVLTAAKGGAPVYAVTNADGIPVPVTDGSTPTDNYVKFEYPQNDLPTITLMHANLRSSGNILDLSSFDIGVKIVIIGDSSIESSAKCGIYRASYGDITLLGPAKLTLNCYSSAIAFEGNNYANSLILKELSLKATTTANVAGRALQVPTGNLTIDGCSVELINRAGIAVYLGQGNVADAKGRGNATISNSVVTVNSKNSAFQIEGNLYINGSNIQLASEARTLYCAGNLSAVNSTLALTGRSNTLETISVGGDFTLRASNAEIEGTRCAIFNAATLPKMVGEYTVIAGYDRVSATTYDEALATTYQYFFAESVMRPTNLPTIPTGTETDPTDFFTEPTLAPFEDPTIAPTATPEGSDSTTVPVPTVPVSNSSGGNSVLFWILAIVMVLGACGAATMAILMLRKNAKEDLDEEDSDEEEPEE